MTRNNSAGLASLAVLGVGLCLTQARAADPAKPAPIAGQDVMGDKNRSGPDGWAWAPVTRDQAPGGKAPGQTASAVNSTPNAQPDNGAGKHLPPGQDPGTPASAAPGGPGSLAAGGARKTP